MTDPLLFAEGLSKRYDIDGATIQAVRTHSWADCIISTPGFDLRQGQVTLGTESMGCSLRHLLGSMQPLRSADQRKKD
jgi:hypothetical protein